MEHEATNESDLPVPQRSATADPTPAEPVPSMPPANAAPNEARRNDGNDPGKEDASPAYGRPPASGDATGGEAPGVSTPGGAAAASAGKGSDESAPVNDDLARVLEIPLTLQVELGRKRVRIGELLKVGAGTVVELDAAAGAPLSIYANQTLIAEGEAVIVGDRYGVRVTDIVSPSERVKRLGGEGAQ